LYVVQLNEISSNTQLNRVHKISLCQGKFPQQRKKALPAIAEPWFLALNARIEIHPVMVPGDLAKTGSVIEAAAKKYG